MLAVVIADHTEDRDLMAYALRSSGLQVAAFPDLQGALKSAVERPINLILLSTYHLPHAKRSLVALRREIDCPIILIVESLTENQHCDFLDDGADLILERPLSYRILTRYTHIILRRMNTLSASILAPIRLEKIVLDPGNRTVAVDGAQAERLTQLEFRLLHVLMTHPGQVIPVDELVELVWGYQGDGSRDLVRGLVRRLRRKIEPDPGKPVYIHNLPGVGYRFVADTR